jgi:hypothetical protein
MLIVAGSHVSSAAAAAGAPAVGSQAEAGQAGQAGTGRVDGLQGGRVRDRDGGRMQQGRGEVLGSMIRFLKYLFAKKLAIPARVNLNVENNIYFNNCNLIRSDDSLQRGKL